MALDADNKTVAPPLDGKHYGVIYKIKDDTVVPPDEWVVFHAKDDAFFDALTYYRDRCIELGADAEQIMAVCRLIKRVADWRAANRARCKVPDAKGEKLNG